MFYQCFGEGGVSAIIIIIIISLSYPHLFIWGRVQQKENAHLLRALRLIEFKLCLSFVCRTASRGVKVCSTSVLGGQLYYPGSALLSAYTHLYMDNS